MLHHTVINEKDVKYTAVLTLTKNMRKKCFYKDSNNYNTETRQCISEISFTPRDFKIV